MNPKINALKEYKGIRQTNIKTFFNYHKHHCVERWFTIGKFLLFWL